MKVHRVKAVAAWSCVLVLMTFAVLWAYWHHNHFRPFEVDQLMVALERYHREHPEQLSVHSDELVRGGYIAPSALGTFLVLRGAFSLTAGADTPSELLAWCRDDSGMYHVVFANGSAHLISPQQAQGMPGLTRALE